MSVAFVFRPLNSSSLELVRIVPETQATCRLIIDIRYFKECQIRQKYSLEIFPVPPLLPGRGPVCLFDRSLEIGSISITCEKNNIVSVCGNSRFSYHFLFPIFLSLANSVVLNVHKQLYRSDEWRARNGNSEAVCLSRLYFALNRIQGSLQIDKKKKKGGKQAFWNVRKVETIRVQKKKDKMKRKHSSGVRKCRRRERSASWMESREFSPFLLSYWIAYDTRRHAIRIWRRNKMARRSDAIPPNRPTDRSIKISQASDASSYSR